MLHQIEYHTQKEAVSVQYIRPAAQAADERDDVLWRVEFSIREDGMCAGRAWVSGGRFADWTSLRDGADVQSMLTDIRSFPVHGSRTAQKASGAPDSVRLAARQCFPFWLRVELPEGVVRGSGAEERRVVA